MKLELRASLQRRQSGRSCRLIPGRVIRGRYLKVVTKHLVTRGYRQRRSADIADICLSGRDQLSRAQKKLRPCLIRLIDKNTEDQRNQEGDPQAVDQRLALNRFCGRPPLLMRFFRLRAGFSYSSDFFLEKRSSLDGFSSNFIFPNVYAPTIFFQDIRLSKIPFRKILFRRILLSRNILLNILFRSARPSKIPFRKFHSRRLWRLKFPLRKILSLRSSSVPFLSLLFLNDFFPCFFIEVFKQDDDVIRNL